MTQYIAVSFDRVTYFNFMVEAGNSVGDEPDELQTLEDPCALGELKATSRKAFDPKMTLHFVANVFLVSYVIQHLLLLLKNGQNTVADWANDLPSQG